MQGKGYSTRKSGIRIAKSESTNNRRSENQMLNGRPCTASRLTPFARRLKRCFCSSETAPLHQQTFNTDLMVCPSSLLDSLRSLEESPAITVRVRPCLCCCKGTGGIENLKNMQLKSISNQKNITN
jgi:hypothetical protein